MKKPVEVVRAVASSPSFDAVVRTLERVHPGNRSTLAVLAYHRVDYPDRTDLCPSLLSADPITFDEQIGQLAERWNLISLDDVVRAREGTPLPRRAVLLTFDDAYRDFADHAWPVLVRHGAPATLFVPTGYPDGSGTFWWDDLHRALGSAPGGVVESPVGPLVLTDDASRAAASRAVRTWFKGTSHDEAMAQMSRFLDQFGVDRSPPPVLNWDELRALHQEGVTLAPHSITHAMLDRLPHDRLTEEIAGSRRRLRDETGADVPGFAYPSGQHNDAVVAAVAEAGIKVSFGTQRGLNHLGKSDWLRLARINVGYRTPSSLVRAQLLPPVSRLASRRR